MDHFKLTSEQCELLVAFESAGSIKDLSRQLRRDESVISRQIKAISEIAPVLEKTEKRWSLTTTGKRLTQWSRDAMESQRQILQTQTTLRIATTREFSAKILIPNLKSLIGQNEVVFSVLCSDDGVEKELLSGRADIGIDCGRPEDPLVKFKSVLPEPYLVVASPTFLKRFVLHRKEDLLTTPHLKFNRDPALRLLELKSELSNIAGSFNDISSVRAACVAGLGWATLPRYTVQSELSSGTLKAIQGWDIQPRSFGVWWIRGRPSFDFWVNETVSWLGKQKV
jgi:DNA-binding transcriptional LysR family regulator